MSDKVVSKCCFAPVYATNNQVSNDLRFYCRVCGCELDDKQLKPINTGKVNLRDLVDFFARNYVPSIHGYDNKVYWKKDYLQKNPCTEFETEYLIDIFLKQTGS